MSILFNALNKFQYLFNYFNKNRQHSIFSGTGPRRISKNNDMFKNVIQLQSKAINL